MGGGPPRTNVKPVPGKKRDLSDSGGGPVLDCGKGGRLPASWVAPEATIGVAGLLVAEGVDVALVLETGVAARSSGRDAECLVACIEAEFMYFGELEADRGGTFIRYWMA